MNRFACGMESYAKLTPSPGSLDFQPICLSQTLLPFRNWLSTLAWPLNWNSFVNLPLKFYGSAYILY